MQTPLMYTTPMIMLRMPACTVRFNSYRWPGFHLLSSRWATASPTTPSAVAWCEGKRVHQRAGSYLVQRWWRTLGQRFGRAKNTSPNEGIAYIEFDFTHRSPPVVATASRRAREGMAAGGGSSPPRKRPAELVHETNNRREEPVLFFMVHAPVLVEKERA